MFSGNHSERPNMALFRWKDESSVSVAVFDSHHKRLIYFLKDWLTNHIMQTDWRYSVFFKEKGAA